jgi:hypothetical protein
MKNKRVHETVAMRVSSDDNRDRGVIFSLELTTERVYGATNVAVLDALDEAPRRRNRIGSNADGIARG